MADTREIVITIKNETGGSVREESQSIAQGQEPNSDLTREIANISMAAQRTFNNAVELTKNILWYKYERHLALTDDYIGQRNLSITRQQVGIAASYIGTVADYTAFGAQIGGPWGAAAGFIIGNVMAGGNLAHNYNIKLDEQNIKLAQMDAQLSFNRQRAGFSLNSGSIGENL